MVFANFFKILLLTLFIHNLCVNCSRGRDISSSRTRQGNKYSRNYNISPRTNSGTQKPKGRYDAYDVDDPLVKPDEAKPDGTYEPEKPNPGNFEEVSEKPGVGEQPYPGEGKPGKEGDDIGANGCICVPYYQCDNGHIIDDGSGIIDPRKKAPPPKELPLDANYQPPYCGTFHVCCSQPEVSTQQPYVHRCGVRNPSGINRRVLTPADKGESDFGEWPWQVAVLKNEKNVNLFQCGGVLIDAFHVLTVAHCVVNYARNYNLLKVRLGEWDTQQTNEFLPHEDYNVAKIIIHPGYKNSSLWNDIAILKLDKKVVFQPNIDTICLPYPNEVFDNQQCVTTGWGKNAYRGGSYSNILKEVSLPVIPHYKCQESLRKTRLGSRFRLHDSFICAGGEEGRDSCKGDGGGPLTCYRKDGTYALAGNNVDKCKKSLMSPEIGLVSWGIDCGHAGVPGVYVKVQKFLDWISKNTKINIENYRPNNNV
ncbi:Serine proteinase stubble-like protein [Dinothrombium tinctorium]|uniref:Serine proteinase stubble-like protein n=1 Tax=Dinothrombium tinctorium TaxID=1965070 RepID=A0A443R0S0_9ACAR|nr:Serine proteinase stubble-like protein [Dinothrombium tinctorium]RWS08879.1 Serine proteinase stubble-like protein [Dinothrombium tinctorium]